MVGTEPPNGLWAAAIVCLAIVAALAAPAAATTIPVRTFDVAGLAPPLDGNSSAAANPAISADGTIVVLDAPGPLGRQVYAVNLLTGQRRLISSATDGGPGNGDSTSPSVSADGSVVAFSSTATNLVAGVPAGTSSVYVRAGLGAVQLVSVAPAGPANGSSTQAAVSSDGGAVAFTSISSNLVPSDNNGKSDVFVRNLSADTTALVSSAPGGGSANGSASNPSISGNGGFVTFDSDATNLVAGSAGGMANVYVRDMSSTTSELVSVSSGGVDQNRSVAAPFHQISSISDNGRYVAFDSDASNLVRGDVNRHTDVFVRDRSARTTRLVSANNSGFEGNNDSFAPTITASGGAVAFESFSSNLAPGGGPRENVFVRDLSTGTTAVIDVGPAGERPQAEQVRQLLQRPVISDTSYIAAFESTAANLTSDPSATTHVMVRLMDPPSGSLVSSPPRRTRQRRVRIQLAVDDPRAKLFACRLDRKTYFRCKPGSVLLPRVRLGRHVVEVRAGGPGMLFDPVALQATFTVVR